MLVFVFGDEHAQRLADLWSGEADAFSAAHGLPHVADELFDMSVETGDLLGLGPQDRMVEGENLAHRHTVTPTGML